MSLEKEIAKLTDAVTLLTVVMRDAQESEWRTEVQILPGGVPGIEDDDPEEEIEAAPAPEPEAVVEFRNDEELGAYNVSPNSLPPPFEVNEAPPPTLDQVRAAFRALAGRVGDVARNQTLTAELLRTHGGGEPPHLKNVPAENYAALIAAVEAAK